jgi:Uma2 family endonuclease
MYPSRYVDGHRRDRYLAPVAHVIKSDVETRRLRRVEYEQLVEMGMFTGERLELLDGLLVVREPQHSPHATSVRLVQRALERAFGAGWDVRSQMPFALDDESEPEPDVVVVPGDTRDYAAAHPSTCALLVEVADASLLFDRRKKAVLYARAGVADYWIVNLRDRVLEVHRAPRRRSRPQDGPRYARIEVLRPPATVAPLALPGAEISVADLLP